MISRGLRRLTIFAFCFVMVLLGGMFPLPCRAEETEQGTIKVGYHPLADYYLIEPDGTVGGYEAEYLKKITEYGGQRFEFVECEDWADALQKLENHQIDLLGTVQNSSERQQKYELCDKAYGTTVAELVALPGSSYIYEDYEAIGNSVIGCYEDYVRMPELEALLSEHNVSPQFRYYDSQEALLGALEAGEVDLIAVNSHGVKDSWKVVAKYYYSAFYFATWKGNAQLTTQLDQVILQIDLYEPTFIKTLQQKYMPSLRNASFTKTELDWITQQESCAIYFGTIGAPFYWKDNGSDAAQGILLGICRQLEAETELKMEIKDQAEEQKDSLELYAEYSLVIDYNSALPAAAGNGLTDPFYEEFFQFYHQVGDDYFEGGAYRIAITSGRDALRAYLEKNYPNCTVIEYASPEECVRLLSSGDVDLTFLGKHSAQSILLTENLNDIAELPISGVNCGLAFQFYGEDAEIAAGIFNKAIMLLDSGEISEDLLQCSLGSVPKQTLFTYLQQHMFVVILLLITFFTIISALLMMLTHVQITKRENGRVALENQDRADFFARVSHDMRTPMNGILGMIRLTAEAESMEEVKSNMSKAEASGEYMLSLINDTLDLQRMENGKLQIEPKEIGVQEMIDNVLNMTRESADQKQIRLVVDTPNIDLEGYIRIDPVRTTQVFANIISNAIKFTPENGEIRLMASCLSRDQNISHVKIVIQDTGVRMSREFLQKGLFRPFSQEHNEMSGKYAGSGLGLSIAKSLVELMDGKIEVESELGVGTTFLIYMDFERVDGELMQEVQQRQTNQKLLVQSSLDGICVLLCEDHPLNAEIAVRLLQKVGCRAVWRDNGKSGLEEFEASEPGQYDAILMDIRMPIMDGIETTKAIRSLSRTDAGTIPIIAMTANAYESDIWDAQNAGMDAHLAKPIDPGKLYETISGLIL